MTADTKDKLKFLLVWLLFVAGVWLMLLAKMSFR